MYKRQVIQQDSLIVQPLSFYQLKAVCSPDFLVHHTVDKLNTLAELPLLLREKGSAIRETFDSFMLLHDLCPQAAWTSTNSTVLMKGAQEGFGIAILPERMVRKKLKQGELCEIQDVYKRQLVYFAIIQIIRLIYAYKRRT